MKVACPFCGISSRIPDLALSELKPLKCPKCGTRFRVGFSASAGSEIRVSTIGDPNEHAIDIDDAIQQASPPVVWPTAVDSENVFTLNPRSRKQTPTTLLACGITCLLFVMLGGVFWVSSGPTASDRLAASKVGQLGGIRSIPAVKAILGDAPSPEWEVVKRYVLRNSLNPDAIRFEKWFPAKNTSPDDSNAFQRIPVEDPQVKAKIKELDKLLIRAKQSFPSVAPLYADPNNVNRSVGEIERRREEFHQKFEEAQSKLEKISLEQQPLFSKLYVHENVMTADRVVRVITRTNAPIIGLIRTDNFYYLKDGKVVKCESGTPADHDKLIEIYYPGED